MRLEKMIILSCLCSTELLTRGLQATHAGDFEHVDRRKLGGNVLQLLVAAARGRSDLVRTGKLEISRNAHSFA